MKHSVLIDGRLIGYRHGGIATYARKLIELLPGMAPDIEFRIAVKRTIPELSDRSVFALTPPHHRFERVTLGLETLVRRPGLVHAVDYVQPLTRNTSTVATVHDVAFINNPELLTPSARVYYEQIVHTLPEADEVITVSEWTRNQLLEHVELDPSKVHVIQNGVEHSLFHPVAGENDNLMLSRLHPSLIHQLGNGRPVVLAVGTIEPRKRFRLLIDAFADHVDRISESLDNPPLLVVAGQAGWLADETISRLRELQRRELAIWLRDINDNELAALYRASTLLVMPSADEGFGLPVLEAMASGTPALVANNGALPNLVNDCGFIEETDSPAAWAEKIAAILHDSEMRDRRARRGIERASGFSWDATARETLQVYRKALSG